MLFASLSTRYGYGFTIVVRKETGGLLDLWLKRTRSLAKAGEHQILWTIPSYLQCHSLLVATLTYTLLFFLYGNVVSPC